jgi:hypothetical protein
MTTRATFDTVDEAALAVGVTAAELTQAVDLAAEEAAKPSAIQCTLPGPILLVRVDFNDKLVLARRDSEEETTWRFELF